MKLAVTTGSFQKVWQKNYILFVVYIGWTFAVVLLQPQIHFCSLPKVQASGEYQW